MTGTAPHPLRALLASPLFLALIVTLVNATKPVVVDDTAYLLFARQIAAHPTDPYGFDVFWWDQPYPAMEILCPPVLPYWLAAGVRLFGENVSLLKLWLFPFLWVLAWALNALLRRFARGAEGFALPLLVLSPAVLPTVNLMLDVPAAALVLASVELFARACARRSWGLAAAAGLVAALAVQTKYNALVAPVLIGWYGVTFRRPLLAAVSLATFAAAFGSWEWAMAQKYGQSHFQYHATGATGGNLAVSIEYRLNLIGPLVGYLGCVGAGGGLLALASLRVRRRFVGGLLALGALGFAVVALVPGRASAIGGQQFATIYWKLCGTAWVLAGCGAAWLLLARVRGRVGIRPSSGTLFLVGWVVVEVVGTLGMTPFAAARRMIGLALALGLLGARAASRSGRTATERQVPTWLTACGVTAGVLVAAIDLNDAFPEKVCAERAAEAVADRPPGATVWFAGHWGFQYYCERAGMKPLYGARTLLRAGDFLVVPVYPEGDGFPRPHAGFEVVLPPARVAEPLLDITGDDRLPAKTVPNFYGGQNPVVGRDNPRLQVRVYKLRADWVMKHPPSVWERLVVAP